MTALAGTLEESEAEEAELEVNTTGFAGAILWWTLSNGYASGSYAVTRVLTALEGQGATGLP